MPPPPRYLPDRPLPPYAYVGRPLPHPVLDPRGHSHGAPHRIPPPLDLDRWRECEDYLRGIDLFNHGFYWEAHDAWEGLWKAAGKRGPTAELLKGLILLAAAGFKALQGMSDGVRKHGRKALQRFREVGESLGGGRHAGLSIEALQEMARDVESGAEELTARARDEVPPGLGRFLLPSDG